LYFITKVATSAFWVGETLEQIIAGSLMAILKKSYSISVSANLREAPSITNTQFIFSKAFT
jgi:hypothetical protein